MAADVPRRSLGRPSAALGRHSAALGRHSAALGCRSAAARRRSAANRRRTSALRCAPAPRFSFRVGGFGFCGTTVMGLRPGKDPGPREPRLFRGVRGGELLEQVSLLSGMGCQCNARRRRPGARGSGVALSSVEDSWSRCGLVTRTGTEGPAGLRPGPGQLHMPASAWLAGSTIPGRTY